MYQQQRKVFQVIKRMLQLPRHWFPISVVFLRAMILPPLPVQFAIATGLINGILLTVMCLSNNCPTLDCVMFYGVISYWLQILCMNYISTMRNRQKSCHVANNIFLFNFCWAKIVVFWNNFLKFVALSTISHQPKLVLIMVWRRTSINFMGSTSFYLNQWWPS